MQAASAPHSPDSTEATGHRVTASSVSAVVRPAHDMSEGEGSTPGAAGPSALAGSYAAAAAAPSWLDRTCPPALLPYAHLMRLDKPIGVHIVCTAC